jgi:hypothetical protein
MAGVGSGVGGRDRPREKASILHDVPIVGEHSDSASGWVADVPAFQRQRSPAFQRFLETADRAAVGA